MTFNSVHAFAMAREEYIGEVHLMAFDFAPHGWALCRGQTLSVDQNQALFAVLGNRYGGDGVTTFMLPNLEGAEPKELSGGLSMHYCIALQGYFPSHN